MSEEEIYLCERCTRQLQVIKKKPITLQCRDPTCAAIYVVKPNDNENPSSRYPIDKKVIMTHFTIDLPKPIEEPPMKVYMKKDDEWRVNKNEVGTYKP